MLSGSVLKHCCLLVLPTTYELFIKLVRSRWPDISSFLRVYGPRRSQSKLTRKKERRRKIPSHLHRKRLVHKQFIIIHLKYFPVSDWLKPHA